MRREERGENREMHLKRKGRAKKEKEKEFMTEIEEKGAKKRESRRAREGEREREAGRKLRMDECRQREKGARGLKTDLKIKFGSLGVLSCSPIK